MKLGKITKNPVALAAIAAAIYFLFIRKSTPAAATAGAPGAAPANGTSAASVIDAAAKLVTEGVKAGSGLAKESIGVEGMGPVTLNGQMASVGALGDLGGSFYGSY